MNEKTIAIDIGGTNVKGMLFDNRKIVGFCETTTDTNGGRESILRSAFYVADKLKNASGRIDGVGIASAGDINADTGEVLFATENLPQYTGTRLTEIFTERYGVPIAAINDAQAALLGEIHFGAAKGLHRVAMITLGTGVGGAFYADGSIVFGEKYDAYRFGHYCLIPKGRPCNCGRDGCAEQYLSGKGLNEILAKHGLIDISYGCLNELYRAGDKAAVAAFAEYGVLLDRFLLIVQEETQSEAVLIGGGVAEKCAAYFDDETVRLRQKIRIVTAQLGNLAGIYGAYVHFQRKYCGKENGMCSVKL